MYKYVLLTSEVNLTTDRTIGRFYIVFNLDFFTFASFDILNDFKNI